MIKPIIKLTVEGDCRKVMTKLTLTNHAQSNTTVLENEFIDCHMAQANGEYVKVYLLLLRHLNRPEGALSVSEMADILDCTEKDVRRALRYWKKQDLVDYCEQTEEDTVKESVSDDHLAPAPFAGSKTPDTPSNIQQYRRREERKELKELLFVAEQYLGKTLSSTDIDTITYFYDSLHMSVELIEYLIEYCVETGHKSMHYIKKVALSWDERKIKTVAEAKAGTILYNKNCYSVLNAYGIKGRAPAASEIAYIKRWNEEYCFALDIILEACNRTMNTIHQPNFEYTDTILKNWFEKKVRRLQDIESLDADFQKEKERKKKPSAKPAAGAGSNKFNNFTGRSYDMDSLERRLVQQ